MECNIEKSSRIWWTTEINENDQELCLIASNIQINLALIKEMLSRIGR